MFRQISEIALDGMDADLRMKIEAARNRGSDERAPARPAVGFGGDQPNRGGVTIEPVAFVGEGAPTNSGIEGDGLTLTPSSLLPVVVTLHPGRVRKALREMTTVSTAATEGTPRPSAVVISLNAWKAARNHASSPTRRVAR